LAFLFGLLALVACGGMGTPGDYVVRGLAVGSGEKDAPAYSPAVATQKVTVGSGAGASVKVKYQPVVTQISPGTRVADNAASSSLTSLV
jgi:hypothetical protein